MMSPATLIAVSGDAVGTIDIMLTPTASHLPGFLIRS
jgi:hypothetical protein